VRRVLISDSLEKKMQFELFPKLETLALKWPVVLSVQMSKDWKHGAWSRYLYSGEGASAILEAVKSAAQAAPEKWIVKLLGRKKQKFVLQILATVGFRDHLDVKGNQLIVSTHRVPTPVIDLE
jgi:hypothetical protein